MKRRILSIITALALCLSLCPTWALAAEADPSLCKHHPEHTEDCGYAAPTEGLPCGHRHTAECYTLGVLPDADGGDYYEIGADTENLLDCQHSHDSDCGYVQADPGAPCGYACRICPIEALIAALPEQVTEDNADDVRAQLDHILDLYRELTEDEQGQLDLSRVTELQGALDGANDPDMIEGEVSVDYQEAAWNGSEVTYTGKTENCTSVESSTEPVTWNAGWYVVNSTVTISEPITVTGEVHLILTNGCTLTAEKGIVVTSTNSLTIYAQSKNGGTLNATGMTDDSGNASAGIGGSTSSVDSGSITIHGGIINATGGVANNNFGNPNYGGAGIGGSTTSSGNGGNSGTIEIYGGTITANSGAGNLTGAGIGGGGGDNVGGAGSNITIYGGSVTAASTGTRLGGAGIGGGGGNKDGGTGENINIYGGTVNATGGNLGAGIGGGGSSTIDDSSHKSGDGAVTISGGIVTAVGGTNAAGIGGGGGYYSSYTWGGTTYGNGCTGGTGSVTITGGIVDAKGGAGNSSGDYAGAPIGNGGNTTAAATVNKTTGIVFENGAGTVYGDVVLNENYAVPAGYSLHISAGASLSGSGTLSGGGTFTTENLTEDMISVPEDWHYTGEDLTEDIKKAVSLNGDVTICGKTFTADTTGWELSVDKVSELEYTVKYTHSEKGTLSKTVTIAKGQPSLSDAAAYKADGTTHASTFGVGETIIIKATPAFPANGAVMAAAFTEPAGEQMAVYYNDTQISAPSTVENGVHTMTVDTSNLPESALNKEIALTVKYIESGNASGADTEVKVTVTAAAKIEKGSSTTFVGALADAFTEGNSGATVTLLSEADLGANYISIDNTFTLDLNGQTVKAADYGAFNISGGSLTIQDSGTGGKIESSYITIEVTGGTLSIKSGTVSGYYGVQITRGTVNISGGVISGTENGLWVNGGGNIVLSGGAYSGRHAIWVDGNASVTMKDMLAPGYAYHQNDIPIAKAKGLVGDEVGEVPLDAKPAWLTGTVTVKECNHTGGLVPSENGYQHGGPCKCCGSPLDTANHTLGADNQCSGCGAELVAKVEKSNSGGTEYMTAKGLNTVFAYNSGYEDATVTLLDDLTNTDYENLPKIDIRCTLNLNGHTIRSDLSSVPTLEVIANGNVTIAGSGEIVSSKDAALKVVGTAVLEGGTFCSGGTYHGAVELINGNLSVTGENVVMENTGSGNGLLIYSLKSVKLSAGKYSGAAGAISVSTDVFTLSSLLNQEGTSRVAYYKDNTTLVTEGLDGQTLPSGSYTVKACTHAYQYTHTTGATTHSQTCPACGDAKAAETCSYDAATGRCACGSTLAVTLPADLALTYDGTAKTPDVTVTVDGTELAAEKYQINYDNNINAGNTAKVTVTAANGSFSGSASTTFSISKASLTIKANDQAITYGGSIAQGPGQVTPTGLCTGDTLESVTLSASSVNVPGGTITPSGAVIKRGGEDVTANYNITYQPGALTINKAQAAVTDNPTANTLTYTGAAQALVTAGTASVGEVVYSLTETGTYSTTIPTGTDAGSYTVWYKVEGTTNYEGTALASVDVTIAQATAPAPQTGTLNVQNGQNRDYTYDLSRLLPVLASGQSFGGEVTYTLKTVNITEAGYYESGTAVISGTTLTLPVKAVTSSTEGQIGTITVTISSKNFANVDATINVNRVNKQPVSIEGVTAQNGTYNGESHRGYTGTPTASPYSGGFKVTYAKADGTALSGAPTNAGDYTVTITLNENNDYTGSRTLSFTISKASITIKADDKRADVGTAKPTLTYTVTGLVSGDTLATEPTLACDADMDTIGQYPIIASGAAVPSGGNYNTAITYVPGTLSVTDPTIPVTGVTLNKTSLTLTVGGSERLTATVAPSDATDKSVTWTSSNTAVATVDAGGNITAVSAGTATITVTTADGAKTATCSVTVRSSSGGGSSYVPSTPSDPSTSTITVPVSGDKDTVRVSASVSGTTATVSKIDTTQIENVIGDNGQASMVEIDFTGLGKTIDTVKLPAAAIKDIAEKAQNEEVGGLTVKLPEAEISFDANALSAIQAQAGSQITLTVTPAKPTDLNNRQKEAVGSAPVFDLTLRSSSGAITDFRGGYATVSLPYTLAAGQNPSGVVVYYLDNTGNITPCTTMYDVRSKSAIFTTGHLSLYFVGYDPAAVWVNPFSDVAEGAWYYDAVRFVSENGLMGGYGNGRFGPNDTLTRAQFAQILFNKEGRPVVNYLLQYGDVATGAWYTEAVRWATSQGVVSGYGNGMFGPNDNITREQLAVMLWRYAGSPAATDKELHFTDADKASGYALEALRWAVENGVMGGYGNGQLAPQGLATRAQVAQMLMNFLEK